MGERVAAVPDTEEAVVGHLTTTVVVEVGVPANLHPRDPSEA